jgi:hypothetical protein
MANENQRKTFLSYSRVNKDFAIKLAKELKSEGFNVWLDQLDIPAGSRWDREVEKALRECEIFMIILTSASVDSENVLDEIGYAIDSGKRFLPVLLEKCEVPFRLRRFQYVDFTNKNFDDGVESAKDLLRNLIAQTTVSRVVSTEPQDQTAQADAERIAAQKVDEELAAKAQAETERKAKDEADRLAAQKAESDRATKQKIEDDRLAKIKAKEEADRLAKQKAEDERLANAKAETERKAKEEAGHLATQKAEEEHKAKEKVKPVATMPVDVKARSVLTAPAQKKPTSKGLIISFIVVVVLIVAGIGFNALRQQGGSVSNIPLVYEIDCADSTAKSYNPQTFQISKGSSITVNVIHCDTYRAAGSISPLSGNTSALNITITTKFLVSGDAHLEIYGNAGKTFVWTFQSAP